jgi:hypothetical protein
VAEYAGRPETVSEELHKMSTQQQTEQKSCPATATHPCENSRTLV